MTNPTLDRITFRTSRLMDFCSEKELIAQTGHDKPDWPLVALKELVDNALDACEEARIPPMIKVAVDHQGITVADNGPGLPEETIRNILDYSVRVSSREAYVSPTRGAQGNALKTILAMPFVLDGEEGKVIISTGGTDYVITFTVDRIRQEPVITLDTQGSLVKNGTEVQVLWPDLACSMLESKRQRFLQIADDYTWLNPHLTLGIAWDGDTRVLNATSPEWVKWRPSDPTSPHWYDPESLARLIAAYLNHDLEKGKERTVREFIGEFNGLAGSAKQKAVLESTGLARQPLSAFVKNGGVCPDLACSILGSMKQGSRPIKPQALGVIGREHLEERFRAQGCDPESFRYSRQYSTEPFPEVYEFAFGYCPDMEARRLVTGVNWSPGIINPFRSIGFRSMDGILQEARAGADEPVMIFCHVASPVVRYMDRGKSAVVVS